MKATRAVLEIGFGSLLDINYCVYLYLVNSFANVDAHAEFTIPHKFIYLHSLQICTSFVSLLTPKSHPWKLSLNKIQTTYILLQSLARRQRSLFIILLIKYTPDFWPEGTDERMDHEADKSLSEQNCTNNGVLWTRFMGKGHKNNTEWTIHLKMKPQSHKYMD